MIKGIDAKTLAKAMEIASQFSKSEQGKKLTQQMKGQSTEQVMSKLRKGEIDIPGVDMSQVTDALEKNPNLLNNLQEML